MVSTTIFGVGGLIIGVIIVLVLTSVIGNAGLVGNDNVNTYSTINESVTFTATNAVQTLDVASLDTHTNTITCGALTYVANQTITGASIATSKITLDSTACSVINASSMSGAGWGGNGTVYLSYPYTVTDTFSSTVVTSMRGNLTDGVGNVSSKIPTILLIVAVVFLFGALVLLFKYAQNMGIGGGNAGSL